MSFETVTIGPCTLIRGDCLEVLPTLRGVDAVVTDPPYGVNLRRGDSRLAERIYGDNEPPDIRWVAEFPSIVWGGNNFCDQLPRSTGWLSWSKNESPISRHSHCELAWTNVVNAMREFRQTFRGFVMHGQDRVHPNQKPLGLMEWCIGFVDGETILDPFMGSGTTGAASIRTGRKFIGIEIDPKYFSISCDRILKAWNLERSKLPMEKPVTYTQGELIEA